MKCKLLYVIILTVMITFYCHSNIFGQIALEFISKDATNFKIENLWDIVITNSFPEKQNVNIVTNILDKNEQLLAEAKTQALQLKPGITTYNSLLLENINYTYNNKQFKDEVLKDGGFPTGEYDICITVFSSIDQTELLKICNRIIVENKQQKSEVIKKKKPLSIGGTYEIGGDYYYCNNSNCQFPGNSAWVNLRPEVSLYGIPLGMQVLFSTENSSFRQNINMVNFHFDGNRLKENVKTILQQKMNNILEKNKLYSKYKGTNISELASIDNVFKNPEVQKDLEILNHIDTLNRRIKYTYNVKSDNAVDSIKNILGINDELESKRKGYNKLIERKQYLDSINRIYQSMDSSYNNIKLDVEKLSNTKALIKKAQSLTEINKAAKLLLNVNDLQIGTCFPNYSDLSIINQPINGFCTELNPSDFYVSFAYGRLNKAIDGIDTINNCYKRNLIAFGLGYGNKNSTNFRIRYLSSKDDPESLSTEETHGIIQTPMLNKVLNLSGSIDIIKNKFNIEAEISGSETIKNTELVNNPEILIDSIPYEEYKNSNSWLINILTQKKANFNTFVDFAYKANANLNLFKNNTFITFGIKRVGPYFQSFGLPFLMKDLMTYEGRIKQNLYKKKITLSLAANYNKNNLSHQNYFTTTFLRLNIEVSFKFPKYPSVTIAYKPVFLRCDTMVYNVNTYNANVMYSYKIKKIKHSTSLNCFYQQSYNNNVSLKYKAVFLTLNHTSFLTKSVSINFSLSDMNLERTDSTINSICSNLSTTFTIKKKVSNTIGVNYMICNGDQKYGVFYDLSVFLSKIFTLKVRVGTNTYDTDFYSDENSYKQFTIRSILSAKI